MISIYTAKKRARLFKISEESQGRKIKLNHALNHVAETLGFKNWAALKTEIENTDMPDPRDDLLFDPRSALSEIYLDQVASDFEDRMHVPFPINFEAWPKKLREMGWDVGVYASNIGVYEPICFIQDSKGTEIPVFLARFNWKINSKNDEVANLFFHNIVELTKGRGDDALVLYRSPKKMELGDNSTSNQFTYSGRYHRGDVWTEIFLNNDMNDIQSVIDQVNNPMNLGNPDSLLIDKNWEFYSDLFMLDKNGPIGYVHEDRPATDVDYDIVYGLYILPDESEEEYYFMKDVVNYHKIDWSSILKGLRETLCKSNSGVRLRIPNNAFDSSCLPNSQDGFADPIVINAHLQDILTESESVDDDIINMNKRWPSRHIHGSLTDQKGLLPQCIPIVLEGDEFDVDDWFFQAIAALRISLDNENKLSEGVMPAQLHSVLQDAIGVSLDDKVWFCPIKVSRD